MEHAILSPTAFNIQNWRFVRVTDPEQCKAIRAVAWDQAHVTDASELLVLCFDNKAWERDPQQPDESMSTAEKYELSFTVLSDVGNGIARQFGLVFTLSETVRPVYRQFGIDLPKFNGTDTFELPVPGTFIVDQQGQIRAEHVSADYKQRMGPEAILAALGELR